MALGTCSGTRLRKCSGWARLSSNPSRTSSIGEPNSWSPNPIGQTSRGPKRRTGMVAARAIMPVSIIATVCSDQTMSTCSLCSVSAPRGSRRKEVLDLPNLPCVAEDECRVADEFERRRLIQVGRTEMNPAIKTAQCCVRRRAEKLGKLCWSGNYRGPTLSGRPP